MKQIKLILKDEIYDSLERDYHNFVRLSTKIDSGFVKPSFDSYLLAKLSENTNFLTEEAVQHLMLSGQYAWARRAMDKEFPDVVQILIEQAANYGFWIAVRHDWGTEELVNASRAWASAIIKQAKGDETQIDVLAAQIKASATNIAVVQERLKTPASQLAHAMVQELRETHIAIEHASGMVAREKLGAMRTLLKLGRAYGNVSEKAEQDMMDKLKREKPWLFDTGPKGFWGHVAAWWRGV
ncbi:hypothetical protein GWL_32500 [Herbaspirillum sp. GW103]|jgi:hypothetical protein|uniref:DUF4088 domain-containing protein n=1 Tax=unclassified Herbaspirillum TaxID=2624150 RepID=UPI00025E45F1|nr:MULTISPECIES: DUF4088 domain-containing protein [unclassified Herbaspirillum]EIJ46222.1 hypothetical protein GWL_32500 [Herbaspirillum sp. GW103]MCI1003617.1 DUF4088 domain-containing protein [Herbaspirillum sp. C7C8]NUT63563.1 DUF4088 domain-containing protein [Herbaspirillum sp. C9C3]